MTEIQNKKTFDLEKRTAEFSKRTRDFCKNTKRDFINLEYLKQLSRSSSSIGANYIEANESLSKKDFVMRVKICRKEAKESIYWLNLIEIDDKLGRERNYLIEECTQLMKIFGAILEKCR
jgi:four helix bundle protein